MRAAPTLVGGVVVVLVAWSVGAADDRNVLPAALVDGAGDRVVARTVVPDAVRKVGEVRLVARGTATVVQTLLATKVLPRVIGEIRKKEQANWPAGTPGREDMERYLAALGRVADGLLAARDAGGGERRIRMLIEFVATPETAGLVLGTFEGDELDGALAPSARRAIETTTLRKTYAFRNMRLILSDAFHVPERDVGRLGPLGPIAGDDRP
jgi:hypothetical protein